MKNFNFDPGQGSPGLAIFVEPDPDDQFIFHEVFKNLRGAPVVRFVPDGRALLECLRKRENQIPNLLFLDLNSAEDLFDTLSDLKKLPLLQTIPLFAFITSQKEPRLRACCEHYEIPYAVKGNFDSLVINCKQAISLIEYDSSPIFKAAAKKPAASFPAHSES